MSYQKVLNLKLHVEVDSEHFFAKLQTLIEGIDELKTMAIDEDAAEEVADDLYALLSEMVDATAQT